VNGKVTGAIKTNGAEESTDVPDYIRLPLEATFSDDASLRDIAEKAVVLSCDGEQSYSDANGEVVRGQQVTVGGKTNSQGHSARLLFDAEGDLTGNYVDRPDSDDFLIVNSGIRKDDAGVVLEVTVSNYAGEDGAFELLSKLTTKTFSYNEEVDETLFAE
jgi:hypothetical protein